ncbi:tRNA uracil 4-sulfurtransferase ThiI [Helcococcus kunzii]|uniref:Probable tRNA sulfurtransferase n=1 Tax=Helcococcus kunzii ATCC 51366 TaxID=883114 RepID=H3NMA2_9FIRM|nr:tRNA uracil 4-sulfurtransferase ThiI [Helcococcus kunzii]EHR35511.1 thiamine biosynthesis/tRNA modification protein ThiI [Helcococcus kunzii ATCC 51366]MCT1796096.1 tRNA 4-thiouridine(8) synthase ThiI [Helcococcus kunzii]QUY64416.1 tRNA 4-thiouridine(8) synthase ThiI [Helcococcus kunzii]QZO76830.1 tRNA 4-thiouridine(8) synthase ThiI [Helcococcus kunzii]
MRWLLGISFGELMLKGKNRKKFINDSIKQVLKALENFEIKDHFLDNEKLFVEVNKEEFDEIVEKARMVFGLSYVYPCLQVEKDLESIEKGIIEYINFKDIKDNVTFKAYGTRADKSFEMNSMEIAREVGAFVLRNFSNFKVDIKNPEKKVYVDIRQKAYIYMDKIPTIGGLPMGTGGKAILLLSGGIDSPVAGFEMARRGVEIAAVHFHSYPFTSERAQDKVKRLAEKMSIYLGTIKLFQINLLPIYTAINKNCKARFTTILSRRFMMRISEILAEKYRYDGFVTGEALGQVASQTIQSISVVNDATRLPIFRPLINMDKSEIIEKAKWIETYDISIEPYDDCCSFFAPDRPATKPRLYDILREEEKLNVEALIEEALESLEIIEVSI